MRSCTLVAYLSIILIIKVVQTLNLLPTNNTSFDNVIQDISFDNVLSKLKVLSEINAADSESNYREDIHLTTPQLLKKYGYPVEEHEVKTSDGYLLTMFRIPKKAPAVLVINGGSLSSDEYLTIGPQAGLGYQLADAGFDVWLANCRGNKYSLGHVKLPTSSAAYWDFTFDEMGRYDTAAMIDYILEATNATDLKLIGYSQSTNIPLILCSERPEYNDKISIIILLSPTVYFINTKLYWTKLIEGPIAPNIYQLAKSFGLHSVLTDREIGPIASLLKNIFCSTPETADIFCYSVLSIAFGGDRNQINSTSLPIIFGHFPTSVSIKTFQHYIYLVRAKKFIKYDYGKDINLVKYGSSNPPEYSLDKVTAKVAIFWANNDWVCPEGDLQILIGKLPNVVNVHKVPYDGFTHADFFMARDIKTLVYDKLVELLKSSN